MSIFATTRGEQRWHCHACGAGGTAIDLLMAACSMNVRAAFDALAARASFHAEAITANRRLAPGPQLRTAATEPHPDVVSHVQRCARLLWTAPGQPVREWLHARGFTDATLRAYQLGADPGPRILDRPRGLPCQAPAAILPVLHDDKIVYFQARYLNPDRAGGRKYDNPTATLAPNPRLATLNPVSAPRSEAVFVCEGLPDALSITQTGHRALALLGVGLASPQIAHRVNQQHPDTPIRVAFDADARGTAARDALFDELRAIEHPDVAAFELPADRHDVNQWLTSDATSLARALDVAAHEITSLELGSDLEL